MGTCFMRTPTAFDTALPIAANGGTMEVSPTPRIPYGWIGDFQNLGIDERQVRANRNPIIQETGVLQSAVFAVDVLFVQRPANALRGTTLELTFHIIRMNGSTGVPITV